MEFKNIIVLQETYDSSLDLVICAVYFVRTNKGDYIVDFAHVSDVDGFEKGAYSPHVFSTERLKSRFCSWVDNSGKHEAALCVSEVEVDNPDESKWFEDSSSD